jgi:hypothetical protein
MIMASPIAVTPAKTYTLSWYARADDPGMEVHMYGMRGEGPKPEVFPLTMEWQRCHITFVPKISPIRITLYAGKTGSFYVDAAQLEEGTQATDYAPGD